MEELEALNSGGEPASGEASRVIAFEGFKSCPHPSDVNSVLLFLKVSIGSF